MSTPSPQLIEQAASLGLTLKPELPFALPSDISSTVFEREYVMATGKARRDVEFRSGRLAAECSLSEIGVYGPVKIADDRSPIWPTDCIGSISHSDVYVWSATGLTADMRSIGVDTEPIADELTCRSLSEEILLPGEAQLAKQLGMDMQTAFTLVFSAKESFYKCVYQITPIFFGFHDVQVKSIDNETLTLQLSEDCPECLGGFPAIAVEYVVAKQNIFTACWLREKP